MHTSHDVKQGSMFVSYVRPAGGGPVSRFPWVEGKDLGDHRTQIML